MPGVAKAAVCSAQTGNTNGMYWQVWVLDTGIVGLDLTQSFAELLTVEARLTLEAAPGGHKNESDGVTYYCRARSLSGLLAGADALPRPRIERPNGPLPLERQNPASTGRQGPTCFFGWGTRTRT